MWRHLLASDAAICGLQPHPNRTSAADSGMKTVSAKLHLPPTARQSGRTGSLNPRPASASKAIKLSSQTLSQQPCLV
jgi:hypothetical protein